MKSKLCVSSLATTTSLSGARFINLCGGMYLDTAANEACLATNVPVAGTFRNLYVKLMQDPDSAASAKGYTFTLRRGAGSGAMGDTAVTVPVLSSTASFQNSDVAHSQHYDAGDRVDIGITPTGSNPANAVKFTIVIEFEDDADECCILMSDAAVYNAMSTSATQYMTPYGSRISTTELYGSITIPIAGTITALYGWLVVAPGSGKTRSADIFLDGSTASGTALTWNNESGVKSSAENIAVAAGKRLNICWTLTGTTPATSGATCGIAFKPTTKGQFILANGGSNGTANNAADTYLSVSGTTESPSTTVDLYQNILTADTQLIGSYAFAHATPGADPNSFTTTLREGTVGAMADCATPFTITLTAANYATAVSASGTRTVPADYTLYDTELTPYSSPTGVRINISYAATVPAAGATPINVSTIADDANAL